VPRSITPAKATTAQRNSIRRILRIARNSAGRISPIEYTITTAASVACGIRAMTGAKNSIVTSEQAAVTISAAWVRAPASRLTAVCDVPPPAAIAPSSAPPALARPVASSSRFGRGAGSPLCANARPAAIVSVKLISAMPAAPGHSVAMRDASGRVRDGRPRGI
jgi:hypothetical protein